MKNYLLATVLIASCLTPIQAQNIIKSEKGFDENIGVLVSMLDDLKSRVTRNVGSLDQNATDYLLDENANRIGAMILHLAATEKHYQVYTFEGRGYNSEEAKFWDLPMNLGTPAREALVGKPIQYYLDEWDKIRQETKRLLKTKDDKWLSQKVGRYGTNNHWAWYHVMEHQANHMGQIELIKKRVE